MFLEMLDRNEFMKGHNDYNTEGAVLLDIIEHILEQFLRLYIPFKTDTQLEVFCSNAYGQFTIACKLLGVKPTYSKLKDIQEYIKGYVRTMCNAL